MALPLSRLFSPTTSPRFQEIMGLAALHAKSGIGHTAARRCPPWATALDCTSKGARAMGSAAHPGRLPPGIRMKHGFVKGGVRFRLHGHTLRRKGDEARASRGRQNYWAVSASRDELPSTETALVRGDAPEKTAMAGGGVEEHPDLRWGRLHLSEGAITSLALGAGLLAAVLAVDAFIWHVVRSSASAHFLLSPLLAGASASALGGYAMVPLLRHLKMRQVIRIEGPKAHLAKAGTPTMGGIFLIPAGVATACLFCHLSQEVWLCAAATVTFGAIGLLDDGLKVVLRHNDGLPGRTKLLLQVIAGLGFTHLLHQRPLYTFASKSFMQLALGLALVSGIFTAIPPGQGVHTPRPGLGHPLGSPPPSETQALVHLPWTVGPSSLKLLLPPVASMALPTFCFAAMVNGVNLTDGLDGLAAGVAAAAYMGMAVAVLPVSPALARFGMAMAGACLGFLVHNHNRARVFMGDTGSLGLGAGLAGMASATGMFLPLLVISGVFVAETLSVVVQVAWFKYTRRFQGEGCRLLRMAPFHHHMELSGLSETRVIGVFYLAAYVLAFAGAWLGIACV